MAYGHMQILHQYPLSIRRATSCQDSPGKWPFTDMYMHAGVMWLLDFCCFCLLSLFSFCYVSYKFCL